MTKRAPTIHDVAIIAKTSTATVSRFFSTPDRVNKQTAARIKAAADQIGYIRNRAAAATRGRRTGIIGMVVPTLESSIFAELIESLTGQLRTHNQTMLLASNGYDKATELEAVKAFAEQGVDGVILIGGDHDPQTIKVLSSRSIPLLCVWNHSSPSFEKEDKAHSLTASSHDSIGIDNYDIGWAAADHVITQGHTDIACIFGKVEGNDRADDRAQGILGRLSEAGLSLPAKWHFHSSYELRNASIIATNLLQGDKRPSAIICGNDIIAFATIWAAQKCGLHVPDDLSVMGIGDFQGAAEMVPALTTIRIPARIIGRLSADRIVEMLTQDQTAPLRHLKVDFEIKQRQSVARLNQ